MYSFTFTFFTIKKKEKEIFSLSQIAALLTDCNNYLTII